MKRLHRESTDTHGFNAVAGPTTNLMEGAPAGVQLPKPMADTISSRPHILAKRSSRWNRRAAH